MKNNLSPADQIPPKRGVALFRITNFTSFGSISSEAKNCFNFTPFASLSMELPVLNLHEVSVVVYNDLLFFGLPELEE